MVSLTGLSGVVVYKGHMTQEQTWTFPERPTAPGPWQDEPDKIQWIDPATDLDCLISRGPSGALCGYVGVPPGHPWHGMDYDRIDVDVHGGLTYADACDEGGHICHVPAPGRPKDVWWLGFDCAHAFDLCPRYEDLYKDRPWLSPVCTTPLGVYRDVAYVRAEVTGLARQVADALR